MRAIRLETLTVSTDATGAGTVTSTAPWNGEIIEVRVPNAGTSLLPGGGTAEVTLTRVVDGGTVLALTNVGAPLTYHPRGEVVTTAGGTTAYSVGGQPVYDTGGGVPVDGYVQCVVAQGSASSSGDLYVYLRTG